MTRRRRVAKREIVVDPPADLEGAWNTIRARIHRRKVDVVLIPHAKALELEATSAWEVLDGYLIKRNVLLVKAPQPKLVAEFEVDVDVPDAPFGDNVVSRNFFRAWGYANGQPTRAAKYASEPAEYGLSGLLVPTKWPPPLGMREADWKRQAVQKQRVKVEVWSDGTRRIVTS